MVQWKHNVKPLKEGEGVDHRSPERLLSVMLTAAHQEEVLQVDGIHPSSTQIRSRDKNYLQRLLNEILSSEVSFLGCARIIGVVFEKLCISYPEEKIFKSYDSQLKIALPQFEKFYTQFSLISQISCLDFIEKIEQLALLYKTEFYYQAISDLSLLYLDFEWWGGEFEYERSVKKKIFLSVEVMNGIDSQYSPILFLQRLPQMAMLMHEAAKYHPNSIIQSTENTMRESLEKTHIRQQEKVGCSSVSWPLV